MNREIGVHPEQDLSFYVQKLKVTSYGAHWYCANTLGPAYNESKDAKENVHYKWVLVVTKLFNITVNYFDAKKSAGYNRVLVVTELVCGTQCIRSETHSQTLNSNMTLFPTPVPPFTYSTPPVKRTDLINSDFSVAKNVNVKKRYKTTTAAEAHLRQKVRYNCGVCVWDLHVSALKRSNHVSYIT